MNDPQLEAYCLKCRTKRVMVDPRPLFTKRGRPAVEGRCPVCGTRLFRMGRTPLHEGMTPPPPEPEPADRKSARKKRQVRKGNLVIVESPTKARTVGRFLGKGYTVEASVGHVRDLLRSRLAVDVEHDFAPTYRVPNEKRPVVKALKAAAQMADAVYLATDPDREGEAIAWHLREVLDLKPEQVRRVVFHEITRDAVDDAFAHPREIDMHLVDAQQARRILDRLVGYKLSPLLWRKIRGHLSAGRVQSVALRLIVEREREIEAFTTEEYWTLDAELLPLHGEKPGARPLPFRARLVRIDGQEPRLPDEGAVQRLIADLEGADYRVFKAKSGQRIRRPAPPFTTSTMQQEASRRLGFTAKKTMRLAQQLYEGIDIGDGQPVGLITYMRTDSTNVAASAQVEAREYITRTHGETFLPERPPRYKTKAKGAQEAHEAIRPTSVWRTPSEMKPFLSRDQWRLYGLIWRRFVASQMTNAIYDTRTLEIEAGSGERWPYRFRASGSTLRFPGFLLVYGDKDENGKKNGKPVPLLKVGEPLRCLRLVPEQHFTQPPPRYTDASLIRTLEEYGIGRPSTYAPIISTLIQRGYVIRDQRRLFPTETGVLVNDLLVQHFPRLINVDFSAQMEARLDEIAAGKRPWVEVVREFYLPFAEALTKAEAAIPKIEQVERVGRDCPECGAPLVVRWGRYGKFIGCSNFPQCRYTEPWLEKIGVRCPKCGGDLVIKRTRRGRTFYGCAHYPECDFTSWKQPLPQPCPKCGGLLVAGRKGMARCTVCGEEIALESEKAIAEAPADGGEGLSVSAE